MAPVSLPEATAEAVVLRGKILLDAALRSAVAQKMRSVMRTKLAVAIQALVACEANPLSDRFGRAAISSRCDRFDETDPIKSQLQDEMISSRSHRKDEIR